jgi:hypothetical protein
MNASKLWQSLVAPGKHATQEPQVMAKADGFPVVHPGSKRSRK